VGRDSKQSAVLKNEGLIWNSGIACLAVASHLLHQEKKVNWSGEPERQR